MVSIPPSPLDTRDLAPGGVSVIWRWERGDASSPPSHVSHLVLGARVMLSRAHGSQSRSQHAACLSGILAC
jgi:hypothetical protein